MCFHSQNTKLPGNLHHYCFSRINTAFFIGAFRVFHSLISFNGEFTQQVIRRSDSLYALLIFLIGHVRYVSPRRARPGGRWVELWRQPRVSLILFFLVTFRYFVSEMVLTCAVSIYIICKYGNGEIFTQSEEENGSRHL